MSNVTVTELQKGGAIASADVNSTVQSWLSASSGIDQDNVRIEGIERRNFAMEAVTDSHISLSNAGRAYASDNEHWTESSTYRIVQVGTQSNPYSGARAYIYIYDLDLEDNETAVIHCSFDYRTTSVAGGKNFPWWKIRLSHGNVGSGAGRIVLDNTERSVSHQLVTSSPAHVGRPRMAGSVSITTILNKTTADASGFPYGGDRWVFLDIKEQNMPSPAPMRVLNINFHYRRFKR